MAPADRSLQTLAESSQQKFKQEGVCWEAFRMPSGLQRRRASKQRVQHTGFVGFTLCFKLKQLSGLLFYLEKQNKLEE